MTDIYFTSDTHFYHKRIIEFCRATRKGETAEEMTELMIEKWNDTVTPKDTVYHLGDVSWAGNDKTPGILARLNGHKILIKGNHDHGLNTESLSKFDLVAPYLVHKIDKTGVVMFHYPILEWDKMHYGSFHLYGHVHGKDMGIVGRAMDVGIDTRKTGDMGLYSWDEVREYMKDRPIVSHH